MQESSTRPHQPARPPLIEARDVILLAGLAGLAPIAWLVPQRLWPSLCRRLARLLSGGFRRRRSDIFSHMTAFAATLPQAPDPGVIHARWIANRIEAELQYLREYRPGGLQLQLSIDGREHLDQAIASGRGAILWVAPQLIAPLVVKKALAEAGFAVSHLSREYHGPSDSRFGRYAINPLSVSRENRYLEARFPMVAGQETPALRGLVMALRRGKLVSITCASYGQRLVPIPLLGAQLPVATGAPSLAIMSGAPLLPVLLSRSERQTFEVVIEPPLVVPQTRDRDFARAQLLSDYAAVLERHLAADPASFIDWRKLVTPPTAPVPTT